MTARRSAGMHNDAGRLTSSGPWQGISAPGTATLHVFTGSGDDLGGREPADNRHDAA